MDRSSTASSPSSSDDHSLLTFGLLILASVAWVVLVVLLLPRFLGRILSFLSNRTARGSFHVSIPILHIYPLAGRAVAHSVCYTVPDGTVSVEELVLQVRWWRKAPESQFRQLLAVDDANTLDPVAHAQQQLERENNASLLKRFFYKLRRWWRRTAVTTDPLASKEPPPLISLICVGLRARLVNVRANYKHVQHVLNIANAGPGTSAALDIPLDDRCADDAVSARSDPDASSSSTTTTSSSYSSVASVETKPFTQRVLELVSLRITSGAFYLCDMGKSPLVRIVVNSAKVRYRYGAPACNLDECRKRFRVRLSGLKLSVADRDTVRTIVGAAGAAPSDASPQEAIIQDNTDHMIRRVMASGYHGLNEPFHLARTTTTVEETKTCSKISGSDPKLQLPVDLRERKQGFRYCSRSEKRETRRRQAMSCVDILLSETSVIDYVFDEPGAKRRTQRAVDSSLEGMTDLSGPAPAPICRVSVVLRGASFSYDTRAVANVERVIERLQPAFYDLMPLAMKAQSHDGKRSATGIQIEIDATPVVPSRLRGNDHTEIPALISVPFDPRPITWNALTSLNVRSWCKDVARENESPGTKGMSLPSSAIQIHAKHVSVRTEVPYRIGAQKRTVIVGKDVSSRTTGVVDMPFCEAKALTVVRTIQQPDVWNDVHVSSFEVILKDSEFTYLPDTTRVIDDLSITIAENSRKPSDIRYFVPFKETTRMRAEDKYTVILACSHDNAWDDILSGQADRFGRVKVCGEAYELILSPSVPTEFFPDTTVMSWTLSLPEAIGNLELPFSYRAMSEQTTDGSVAHRVFDSDRSVHHRVRPHSLAQRVRSQLSILHQHEHSASVKRPAERTTIKILQAGKTCILSGKVLVHVDRSFMGSDVPAFLDSVNRSDVSFRASSISLDVNPHHVPHFLSLCRNYTGTGNHTISTAERSRLHITRNRLAQAILDESRYPSPNEYVVLGLGAEQVLRQACCRSAMDDLFCVNLLVDSAVLRLHKLPHALCHFSERSDKVCSVLSEGIGGSIRSNRLGSDLEFATVRTSNRLTLHCEYRSIGDGSNFDSARKHHNSISPVVVADEFEIRKRSRSCPNWGPYHSVLEVRLGEVSGCLMDESLVGLSRMAVAAFPEPFFEDQVAVASLLSVDNIDVTLRRADLLILSTSSTASAERSGQMNKLSAPRRKGRRKANASKVAVPTFIAGVTQFRVPAGLRFCMSNLASEVLANQSRLYIPDASLDVLMSWGGKLTTWIDDATLKAQVAHAILARNGNPQGSFRDVGLMRRVAVLGEARVDIVFESRPSIWSQTVVDLQKHHVSQKAKHLLGHLPTWWSQASAFPEEETHVLSSRKELDLWWWMFLRRSRRASVLSKHMGKVVKPQGKLESISVVLASNGTIVLSPESLEMVNDIVIRCKERAAQDSISGSPKLDHNTRHGIAEHITSADVAAVWDAYEASRAPKWTRCAEATPGVLLRGYESNFLKVLFLFPQLPGDVRRKAELFGPESVGDGVHIGFPMGIHFVQVERTVVDSAPSEEDGNGRLSSSSNVSHVADFHSLVPSIAIGCDGNYICRVSDVMLTFREKCVIRNRTVRPSENPVQSDREDKRTLAGKISSVGIGEDVSSLHLYACFGRVAAIFLLMSRALALQYSSLLRLRDHRISILCKSIFRLSLRDLEPLHPCYIRGFLSEVSKINRDQFESSHQRTVAFSEELPPFVPDHVTDLTERIKHHVVSSVEVALKDISLRVACENILTADMLVCKGSSTADAHVSCILQGHALSASFGTVSICILDDVAADTLRMVSDVASFVRRATFALPMLRYDGHADSQRPVPSELVSFSCTNENFVKSSSSSLTPAPSSQGQNSKRSFPTLSQGLHQEIHARRPNSTRVRLRVPRRTSSIRVHRNSFGSSPKAGFLTSSALLGSDNQKSMQHSVNEESSWNWKEQNLINSGTEGGSILRHPVKENTVQRKAVVDRRRSRPLSSAEIDQRTRQPLRLFSGTSAFEEDKQDYAYVAIPTAGEAGPPRKRAKSRVRVSPILPPEFSDFEQFSSKKAVQRENVSSHRRQTVESRTDTRRAQEGVTGGDSEDQGRMYVENITKSATAKNSRDLYRKRKQSKDYPPLTAMVSCREIVASYFRRNSSFSLRESDEGMEAEICCSIIEPRLSLMSSPSKGSYSVVVTASSANLTSANNPNCVLGGSVSNMGVTVSIAQSFVSSTLPKLIASARVSEFKTTLCAKDLRSVMKFREEFKSDIKAVVSAFITTKSSITKMARAARLSKSKMLYPGQSLFSTIAFDLLLETSSASLEGFHPKDSAMGMSYFLDGMFFSVVASEDDNAALTLGVRLYGHRLSLFAPSWPSDEVFHFPSLDARGVQWGEATGLPTFLKVSAEPLVNCTSIQGLRHVLFTVAGLMAFQSTVATTFELNEQLLGKANSSTRPEMKELYNDPHGSSHTVGTTPFTRSFAAWERTKGIRMDISIRPMSISLASGQVVALFELEAITGIFEWNKLVITGVQLHSAVNIPRISLMFIRMPTSDFSFSDVRLDERRASMSIALERSRIDILKTQDNLTHTFVFRIDVFAVSGQVRPWRLLMDVAVWTDEQEFVSDLQSINYTVLSTALPRTPKSPSPLERDSPLEHRIILVGFNIQRFKLAVALLNTEEYLSSRLALRATELHLLARRRFDSLLTPRRNILEVKTHFIGVLWENSALLSTHHSRIIVGVERPSLHSDAHIGAVNVVMVAGTWRVCPRKDVVMAILEAKNGKDNRYATGRSPRGRHSFPDVLRGCNAADDSVSSPTEGHGRLLVERLRFKILQTSGFIEGLEIGPPYQSLITGERSDPHRTRMPETSKLSVPAFSIAMVRDESHNFDVIDVDFSGREGEFPRMCLQKASNLFSEMFGAVASDHQASDHQAHLRPVSSIQETREVSRDVSVLIRFGKSLYRAQEEGNTSIESKFCFFAGRTSTILVSLSTKPMSKDENSHTTIISGTSPKLALEITPLIEGARIQSLRLIDARFLHSVTTCHPQHTLVHVVKVTALLDTKTLLLTQGRRKARKVLESSALSGSNARTLPRTAAVEGNVMLVLGRPQRMWKITSGYDSRQAGGSLVEPDIRLQVKLPLKNESPTNQVDLFVERLQVGICRTRNTPYLQNVPLGVHVALHEINLRGQWEILSCKLRLRENLFGCSMSGLTSQNGGLTVITSIMNRLHFECMQYGNHTMKLSVDAVAAICSVPKRDILIESTEVSTEISHTMIKAVVRLSGQLKKLRSEVSVLMERELSKVTKRSTLPKLYTYDGRSPDSLLPGQVSSIGSRREAVAGSHKRTASISSERSEPPAVVGKLKRTGEAAKVCIKGDGLRATLRGYQFEETQLSAVLVLVRYDVSYEYDFTPLPEPIHIKRLSIDFASLKMAYNDDERGIHSDLFKVPNPSLKMKVVDSDANLTVELLGDLELKLGHGFYYWQDFKKLSELTIQGIMPILDASETVSAAPPDRPEIWDGRVAQVSVRLNPRIDVIGDLTSDMLQFMERRRGRVDIVPKHLYDYIVVPLETLSEAVCEALLRKSSTM